jgi:hypothetical protein
MDEVCHFIKQEMMERFVRRETYAKIRDAHGGMRMLTEGSTELALSGNGSAEDSIS